ncbi:hypothetical protein OXPF_02970 [Oxobacter pfennigii]|uniref:Uncharacterized protein n=1 Tax=Oxobacter pfennigii TaxID=36849 RepID=A0A0P8YGM3_9CLOT|nr:hypothetical protein [Oxobacter pfennigii]KPU46187.1 hypothetical protein OXPF_02970 [Oxobacter pfennigii]
MVRNFYRFLIETTDNRVHDIQNDTAKNNRRYKEFTVSILKMLKEIYKELPVEYHEILEELEDTRGERDLIAEKILYRQGLIDGIRISNVHTKLRDEAMKKIERLWRT